MNQRIIRPALYIFALAITLTIGIQIGIAESYDDSNGHIHRDPVQTYTPVPAAVAPSAPIMIAENVMSRGETFNVVVGQTIHVEEGMIDKDPTYDAKGEASTLIGSRTAGNKNGIERAYGESIYRHYDESKRPACVVEDQDAVGVLNDNENYLHPGDIRNPLRCKLNDGTTIYATAIQK